MTMDLEHLQYSHVRYIRLTTMDELITQVEDGSTKDKIKLVKPMMPVNNGNGGIGLVPWGMFNPHREFEIDRGLIMFNVDCVGGLAKGYIQVSSDIKLADSPNQPNNVTPFPR